MRIGVATFHASINYGSYWQARCLVEGLRTLGHDAVLMEHRSDSVTSRELRNAFQPELPERTARRHLPALGRKVRAFAAAVAALPRSAPFPLDRPEEAEPFDAVVVGSDEVWNFSHPWFGGRRLFFGEGVRPARLISYAASFGNHDAAWGVDAPWAERLRRFDALSVRDENSRAIVRGATGHDPAVVVDPCLAFPKVLPDAAPPTGRYVLLYGHGLPLWLAQAMRRRADREGARLVSVGYPHALADEEATDAGPFEFARWVAGAEAVATSFFHGSVFALHYGRPLIAAASPYRRLKLEGLVAQLGAERHLVEPSIGDAGIDRLLDTPPTPAIAGRIAAERGAIGRLPGGGAWLIRRRSRPARSSARDCASAAAAAPRPSAR